MTDVHEPRLDGAAPLVLVIDDAEDLRVLVAELLETHGFRVMSDAADLSNGLESNATIRVHWGGKGLTLELSHSHIEPAPKWGIASTVALLLTPGREVARAVQVSNDDHFIWAHPVEGR